MNGRFRLLVWVAMLTPSALFAQASHLDQITVVMPTPAGPTNVAEGVSTVLKWQIRHTLRSQDDLRPKIRMLGRGEVYMIHQILSPADHVSAQRLARVNGAQLALWGNALEYSDGAVAQMFLSIVEPYRDFRETAHEVWSLNVDGGALKLDVPRHIVEFSPIAVNRTIIQHYASGNYLRFCAKKGEEPCVDPPSNDVFPVKEWDGDYAKVRAEGKDYWIYVPFIDKGQSEVVDFVAGVIRYFRGDWNGVLENMKAVLDDETRDTEVAIDARIYMGVSRIKLGQSGLEDFRAAYALNSLSVRTVRYLVMGLLTEASQPNQRLAKQYAADALSTINSNARLFATDDPWVANAKAIASRIVQKR